MQNKHCAYHKNMYILPTQGEAKCGIYIAKIPKSLPPKDQNTLFLLVVCVTYWVEIKRKSVDFF